MDSLTKQALIEHLLSKEGFYSNIGTQLPVQEAQLPSLDKQSPAPSLSSESKLFTSHQLLLEGIEFNLVYTPLKHLGYKALLALFGPLYAEGISPSSLSIVIGLSSRFKKEQIEELWAGMAVAIKEHKVEKVELNLLPSLTGLTISLTSQGEQKKERFVQPTESKVNHLLAITGTLGAAYLGAQILERERRLFEESNSQPQLEEYTYVLGHYLNPKIELSLFELFTQYKLFPSAGEFIREGLAHAVKSMAHKEGLGARLHLDRLPINSEARRVAEELSIDPVTSILNGGDDYQFLFSFPIDQYELLAKEFPTLEVVGHLTEEKRGCKLILPDGQELELKAQAWDL